MCLGLASSRAGAPNDAADVHLALLRYRGGNFNPRPHGLTRLAWETRQRTSVAIDLAVQSVDAETAALFAAPLLVWTGTAAFAPLPAAAIANLRRYLRMGGSLLVEDAAADSDAGFDAAVRRDLGRILAGLPHAGGAAAPGSGGLGRIGADHVLYKSFYLVGRPAGRLAQQAYLEGAFVGRRLAVLYSRNDMLGAMARDPFGDWDLPVVADGEAGREMAVRLGINWLLYVLCLDYKADQVHLPFILQRRH